MIQTTIRLDSRRPTRPQPNPGGPPQINSLASRRPTRPQPNPGNPPQINSINGVTTEGPEAKETKSGTAESDGEDKVTENSPQQGEKESGQGAQAQ
ncbi:hypothetical protein AMTR_s00068p00136070 [Amborella trichopoda]|uniref:Uncharacterized protein n=1 Tax=Amborella trichopoda TaxID=13333 RepID=U5DE13_AMBTC|nr:hypothetical protein AMTR_s00068p00136070 [Amborella trichopoda]